jgi:hypothetical protein
MIQGEWNPPTIPGLGERWKPMNACAPEIKDAVKRARMSAKMYLVPIAT